MSDFDFKAEADLLIETAGLLDAIPLERIRAAVNQAHTIGPILEPTKYREALHRGDMDEVAELARLAQVVAAQYRKMKSRLEVVG